MLFNSCAKAAESFNLPDDFNGQFTLAQVDLMKNDEEAPLDTEKLLNIAYEIGSYFYNKYTLDDIFREDFIAEIKPFFPGDTETELEDKLRVLRFGVNVYEEAKKVYNSYVDRYLFPKVYRKVKSENDYDHPDEVPYIESEEGYFAKVYNFKKFLTYSDNKDERLAIVEFEQSKEDENSIRNKIVKIIQNADWKKMLFYGSVYENPLASKEGVTKEQTAVDVKAQLLSKSSFVLGQKELDFGLRVKTVPYTFVVANNISEQITKPQLDFADSENVEKAEVFYPVPLNSANLSFVHKYFGDFMLPIKITVADVNKPVMVRTKVKMFSCDDKMNCAPEDFNFELPIQTSGEEILSNGYENYINTAFNQRPQEDSKYLKLRKFVVDNDKNNQQILRLEFVSNKKVENFKVFVESNNGIILFKAPLVRLQDNKIYVRIQPDEELGKLELLDEPFTISAVLNNMYYYRSERVARTASEFDTDVMQLNLGLLMLAVLGGFILNFMPCVFPVISLKMMAFAKIKKRQRTQLRRDLLLTVAGIFCGFSFMILMLWGAKYLGYSLGWGMQFQNMGFLVAMTFLIICIIIALPMFNFNNLKLPDLGKYSGFIIGNMAVLLATPCTGPYLASAVGFALAGGYSDILIMMYGIAIGLALPYLMILLLKEPETFFPRPGAWMVKLEIFMRVMLYLTLVWFLMLILGQTDGWFVGKFIAIILVFVAILKLCKMFLDYLDGVLDESIPIMAIMKIRRGCYLFMILLFTGFTLLCTHMANSSYERNYATNMQNRLTFIDRNLIDGYLMQGHPVLVEIGADWCLTCHVNNALVFNKSNIEHWQRQYNLEFVRVDWTNYNREILDYMERYGRKGLPFYILYTPFIREGMVLPETFHYTDLGQILSSSYLR